MKKQKRAFALTLFEWAVLIALASTTFLFGMQYIGPVFGQSVVADVLGALYCLLLLDVGFLVWRGKRMNSDLTNEQRIIATALTIMSFVGSLFTTITELVLGTSLISISQEAAYAVGFVTFILLLVCLAAHAAGLFAYTYYSLDGKLAENMAKATADMIDAALEEAERQIALDKDAIVASMRQDYRQEILSRLGFTSDLRQIGRGDVVPGEATAVPDAPDAPVPHPTPREPWPRPETEKPTLPDLASQIEAATEAVRRPPGNGNGRPPMAYYPE